MTTHKKRRWVRRHEMQTVPVAPGGARAVLAYCDELMCVENAFEAGAVGTMHSHPHTQITYILSGAFEFTIGEETQVVRAGDTLLKQHGVIHGCTCLEAGAMLDVFTPMREDFVSE